MKRYTFLLVVILCCVGMAPAQESLAPQFHGFLTQSFIYGNGNNYLGMNTRSGSFGWTEGVLDVNDQLTGKLRVGAQLHTTHLGRFGSWSPGVDWALADYYFNEKIGVRAGKVKIRWGLYNDTQDADPGYLWCLLPEPIYAIDWRATDLSQAGVQVYGRFRLGRRQGSLEYSAYYGYYWYASNDGLMEGLHEEGLFFAKRPRGITPGFDLRWKTPLPGIEIGGSLMTYNLRGRMANGTLREPITYWPTYYAQYRKNKVFASAQYDSLLEKQSVTIGGVPQSSSTNNRGWFAMAGYHLTAKVQLGVYHSRNLLASAPDASDPSAAFHDWVISGRYDLNPYFYTKLEGHLINGTGLGFYDFDNPNGLQKRTSLLVAKLGFSF